MNYNPSLSPPLTQSSNKLAADVVLTTLNTFYDGPSLSLAPGTWFLSGAVCLLDTVNQVNFTAKLWDGTTVAVSAEITSTNLNGNPVDVHLSAIVVLTVTSTLKISVASTASTNGLIKAAAPQNGAGNNASYLNAIKIG